MITDWSLEISILIPYPTKLKLIVRGKIDILVITETKTDSTFSINQFVI